MKNKYFAILLCLTLLLPSCSAASEENSESKGDISSDLSQITSSEATSNETTSSEATSSEATSSEATSNEATSSEATSNEATSSEATSSEVTSNESTSSESTSSETTSSEATSSEATSNETTSSEEDTSVEIVETPVIPVPDKVVASDVDAFFNDAMFVGNSIMLGYQKFANTQRAGSIPDFLGTSKFFVAGSFGVYHNNRTPASKEGAINPSYQGVKYSVEDAVGAMGAKTVYINFMGLNDLALYYDPANCATKCARDVVLMIETIKSRYPDVKIVVLSATYLTKATNNQPSLNNRNLSLLNNYLLNYCNANGDDFVDIASQLTENGCLADSYASDGYCHIGKDGYKIWTAILREYAKRKIEGTYVNPEKMPILNKN